MKIRIIEAGYRGPVEIRIRNLPVTPPSQADTPGDRLKLNQHVLVQKLSPGVQSNGED